MQHLNMKCLFSKSMSKKKLSMMITSILVSIAAFSYLIHEGTKKTVALAIDGEKKIVKTHAKTVEDLIHDLGIDVQPEDRLSPKPDTKIEDDLTVVWEPAIPLTLVLGDKKNTVFTTAKTVKELLTEEEVDLGEHDKVTPDVNEEISANMKVEVDFAIPLTLIDGKKKEKIWSTETTVADLLESEKVKLEKLDRVSPDLEKTLNPDDVIRVVRVKESNDVVEEETNFAVETKKDSNLTKGNEQVVQEGQKGLKKKHYKITKENGKEVSRELIKEEIVKESKNKIIAVGTKPLVAQVSRGKPAETSNSTEATKQSNNANTTNATNVTNTTNNQNKDSGNEFYVTSTAYTASCNGCSGKTATGIDLKANSGMKVIAVDPSVIPLGSKVHVEGYGYAIAGDTGSAIKGNKIDVFFPEKSQAYRWGSKQVKVKVLH